MLKSAHSDSRYVIEWMRPVRGRFKVGDRVVFSHWADKNGVSWRRKGGVRSGVVTKVIEPLNIEVLLDGYKHASKFHHMFFIPAREAGN